MEPVKELESIAEPAKDYKEICGKCYLQIIRALQDVLQHPIDVGNSVETETTFIDDKNDRKYTLYMKVKNEGKAQNDPM